MWKDIIYISILCTRVGSWYFQRFEFVIIYLFIYMLEFIILYFLFTEVPPYLPRAR